MESDEIIEEDTFPPKSIYDDSVALSKVSVKTCKFCEDTSVTSRSDRYVLLTKDDRQAIFHQSGILTTLNVTRAGAVKYRKPTSKTDEYTTRLRIGDENTLKGLENGFQELLDLQKNTPKACENIAVSSGRKPERVHVGWHFS